MKEEGAGFKRLSDMSPGESGTIVRIEGASDIKRFIKSMGVTPGASVCFQKKAPLGDPFEIRIRGYELAIRQKEAADIIVLTDDAKL